MIGLFRIRSRRKAPPVLMEVEVEVRAPALFPGCAAELVLRWTNGTAGVVALNRDLAARYAGQLSGLVARFDAGDMREVVND